MAKIRLEMDDLYTLKRWNGQTEILTEMLLGAQMLELRITHFKT